MVKSLMRLLRLMSFVLWRKALYIVKKMNPNNQILIDNKWVGIFQMDYLLILYIWLHTSINGSVIDYIYCQDNASYEHIAWFVVPSADNLHPCLAMAYRWMFRYPPTLGLMVVAPSRPMVKTLIAVCITSFLRRKLRSSINESSTGHSAAGIFRLI